MFMLCPWRCRGDRSNAVPLFLQRYHCVARASAQCSHCVVSPFLWRYHSGVTPVPYRCHGLVMNVTTASPQYAMPHALDVSYWYLYHPSMEFRTSPQRRCSVPTALTQRWYRLAALPHRCWSPVSGLKQPYHSFTRALRQDCNSVSITSSPVSRRG